MIPQTAERQPHCRMRERRPTPQTPRATIWGIGKTPPLHRFLSCYHHLPPWELLLTALHDAQRLQMGSDLRSDHIIWYTWAALGLSQGSFFFVFKSTIYYAVLDHSPRQTIQTKYSLRVSTCKIGREITALTSPFRAVMSPARAKHGQENDKENWALRRLPKPALAPDADHPLRMQSTPKDVPSQSRMRV
jgi:hypothetical protein